MTTGKLAMSNLLMRGRTMSSGSSLISSSSLLCTSMAAVSMSVPQAKLTRTALLPSEESEVISSTPGTVATISSMIWVTSRSITSGLAPSYSGADGERGQLDVGQQVDLQPAQGDGRPG